MSDTSVTGTDLTSTDVSWDNPALGAEPGILRDPFLLRVGERWYLTATPAPFWEGPVEGIRMWSSPDLRDWTRHDDIVSAAALPADAWCRDRMWAPEILQHDGAFWLTFNGRNDATLHRHSVALARADRVTGPYELLTPDRPLVVLEGIPPHYRPEDPNESRYYGNDGTLVVDGDAVFVFYADHRGIHGREVDLAAARTVGPEFRVVEPSADGWDQHVEGPSVLRDPSGRLHCFYSSFTRSYEVGSVSAPTARGPWVKAEGDPLVRPRGSITAAGHNCVFTGPDGGPWIAYHVESSEFAGERLAIDPVWLDADGRISTPAPTLGPLSTAAARRSPELATTTVPTRTGENR